jgi:hypothetical protein
MDAYSPATAVRAAPAIWLDCGCRFLVLRQHHKDGAPPAFAWIEQRLLRPPQRLSRHGAFFAIAFLPEIMAWLGAYLGRPSLRSMADRPQRNPRWPVMTWHGADRVWPNGMRTTEWFVDITFHDESSWAAFQERWRERLQGEIESHVDVLPSAKIDGGPREG